MPEGTDRTDVASGASVRHVPRRRVRFAFTISAGPHAGLTVGGWRLWVPGEDTYLTNQSFGDVWKLSLHGDDAWQWAVTSEHVRDGGSVVPATMETRAWWKFTPPPMGEGGRLAFVVAVPRGALQPRPLDPRETHIAVEDRWDRLTVARIHMTEAGVAFTPRRFVGGPLQLSSGRQVWLSARAEAMPAATPAPPPDGAVVEIWTPETHDVTAPGLFLRPLNWK
jgi:hypothetical protein